MNVFDLFEYDDDPENEGVEKLRFHLKRNRFKSLEKPKLHKHSHRIGEQDVEETASMTKGMKSNHDAFKMQEARKPDVNFDIEDIKRLEQIKDLATLKTQAMNLIAKPSAKPMRPEKVEWFRSSLERMDSPMKVIKLMYDLMLSGEGHQVIGSRRSMNPNSYRSRFGETVLNPKDMHGDYDAKRKALHDLSRDPNVDQKEVTQRRLDLDKEAKAKGVTESSAGAKYKIKSIGKDKNGDYYISPNTGKKVYKQAKVGDHETPRGEVKPKVAESNEPRFLDDDFYAYDPETMEIKDTWSHKSVGRRHSEYRAQQEGWKVVSGMRAKSLGLHHPTRNESKQRLDPKCWTGYKKQGTKMKGGVRVNNCVPAESIEEENKGLYYNVNKRKKAGTSRPAGHPKAPTAQAWKDAAKTAKKEATEPGISKDKETKFHAKLDQLVHDTFGKRQSEMMEALEEYLYELELAGYEVINEERTRP